LSFEVAYAGQRTLPILYIVSTRIFR